MFLGDSEAVRASGTGYRSFERGAEVDLQPERSDMSLKEAAERRQNQIAGVSEKKANPLMHQGFAWLDCPFQRHRQHDLTPRGIGIARPSPKAGTDTVADRKVLAAARWLQNT